jgi:UDP-N-acetylmuramyl pentapeptide phosphotransferase/UDP-N-acetylglucosamine-1-phosphate transferase
MILEFLAAAALACLVSAVLCPLAMAAGVMDAPDRARKQQKKPIPTSGGLAMAIGFAAAIAALSLWPQARWSLPLAGPELWTFAGALVAVAAALAMGLADDVFPLPARFKFGVVALIGLVFALFVARAESFPIAAGLSIELGLIVGVLGSTLWLFTIVNATNFIDGANGLAMGSTAIGLSCLGVIGLIAAAPHAAALAFCGAGALVGFLFWNFPKGAIFAGDAGSLFAGMLAAVIGLILAQDAGVSPVIAAIAFFPILADVLLTLAWRVGQKRPNLFDGHREHLYQIGLRAGISHARVALIYWATTLHCGLIAVVAAHVQRIPSPDVFLPQAGDVAPEQVMFMQGAAWLAVLSPYLALAVLAMVSLKVAGKIRDFARARGLDGE